MKGAVDIIMHTNFPDVNNALFLWRDKHNVLHASKKGSSTGGSYGQGPYVMTLCERGTQDMTYAGRLAAPTCIECVSKP